jgi:hypothetical protein
MYVSTCIQFVSIMQAGVLLSLSVREMHGSMLHTTKLLQSNSRATDAAIHCSYTNKASTVYRKNTNSLANFFG